MNPNKFFFPMLMGLFAFNAMSANANEVTAPKATEGVQVTTAPVPPTLVVRVKVDANGKEEDAQLFFLNEKIEIVDEASALAAIAATEAVKPLVLDEQVASIVDSTDENGDEAWATPGWNFGVRFGNYRGAYGFGYNNYYGYGRYNRGYYPSYGYRYGGYNYPYYNYGYRYNAYPYRYYYYGPRRRW